MTPEQIKDMVWFVKHEDLHQEAYEEHLTQEFVRTSLPTDGRTVNWDIVKDDSNLCMDYQINELLKAGRYVD